MDDFLDYLIKKIADDEKAVTIKKSENESDITYTLNVAPEDFGKIIGRSGKTINAIRNLLHLYSLKNPSTHSGRVIIKVEDRSEKGD